MRKGRVRVVGRWVLALPVLHKLRFYVRGYDQNEMRTRHATCQLLPGFLGVSAAPDPLLELCASPSDEREIGVLQRDEG